MRKLSMTVVLPLAHVVAYALMFKGRLLPYTDPTVAIRLWFALNGPVLMLVGFAKWVATTPRLSPHIMGGVGPIYLVFLFGGVLLWLIVGRSIDHLRNQPRTAHMELTFGKALFSLFLIATGIYIALEGLRYLVPAYPGQRISAERAVEAALVLLWSAVLIALPLRKLLSGLRNNSITLPASKRPEN